MQPHKYKVGQKVRFFPRAAAMPSRNNAGNAASERYEIVRLLPNNGTELQYRIKECSKGQERVVTESEIG